MKILHITEAYGGGVFTSVNQLVAGQSEAGHEVHLAVNPRPETPANWASIVHPGVKVQKLALQREISPSKDFKGVLQIRKLIQDIKPDAIHLHSSKAGFAGRVAAFTTGYSTRTFYSPRAFAFLAPGLSSKKRGLYYLLEKVGSWFGGTVVACSGDELIEAKKMGLKSVLINNSINISAVESKLSGLEKTISPLVRIVTAGRVCDAKRPALFVAVAEELKRRNLPVEVTWLGGGDEFPKTTAATCTGWLNRDTVLKSMRTSADIYLQTSSYEGMPLSVLEAQCLGLPAVVTDAVGNRSAVNNGVSGFVVPADAQLIADKLEKLVQDKQLLTQMGLQAAAWAKAEFDTPLMLQRYESLFGKKG